MKPPTRRIFLTTCASFVAGCALSLDAATVLFPTAKKSTLVTIVFPRTGKQMKLNLRPELYDFIQAQNTHGNFDNTVFTDNAVYHFIRLCRQSKD